MIRSLWTCGIVFPVLRMSLLHPDCHVLIDRHTDRQTVRYRERQRRRQRQQTNTVAFPKAYSWEIHCACTRKIMFSQWLVLFRLFTATVTSHQMNVLNDASLTSNTKCLHGIQQWTSMQLKKAICNNLKTLIIFHFSKWSITLWFNKTTCPDGVNLGHRVKVQDCRSKKMSSEKQLIQDICIPNIIMVHCW